MATGYTDHNGNTWSIDGSRDNFVASITAPAFGVPGGRKLVFASSLQEAQDGIDNLVDIWNETGKLTQMGSTLIVDAKPPSSIGAVIILVAILYAFSKKGRR